VESRHSEEVSDPEHRKGVTRFIGKPSAISNGQCADEPPTRTPLRKTRPNFFSQNIDAMRNGFTSFER
jgi:hypothetical protein